VLPGTQHSADRLREDATGKRTTLVLLSLILLIACYRFYLADYLPPIGDGARHAWIVETIAEKGEIVNTIPDVITNDPRGTPIEYPATFHLTLAIGYLTTGQYRFMVALFGVLSVLLLFLIGRDLLGSPRIGLLAALVGAVHPYHILFTSTVFMESLIVLLVLAVVWAYYKFTSTNRMSYLVLASTFLGGAVATKQTVYMLLPAFFVYHLVVFRKQKWHGFGTLAILMGGAFLVALPALVNFTSEFGSPFFTTGDSFLDRLFLSKSSWTLDPYFQELASSPHYMAYLGTYWKPAQALTFYAPSDYYGTTTASHVWQFVFVVLLVASVAVLVRQWRKNKTQVPIRGLALLVAVLVCSHVALLLVSQPRYLIHSMLLVLPLVFYWVVITEEVRNKLLVLLPVAVIVALAGFLFVQGDRFNKGFINSIAFVRTGSSIYDEIAAYDYVRLHTAENDVIADQENGSCEALYYLRGRRILWCNPYGGCDLYMAILSKDQGRVMTALDGYGVRYLVLKTDFVTSDAPQTLTEIPADAYEALRNSAGLKLVFSKPGIEVYEVLSE